jgi:uncharacterized protein YndB with AHSA1/START domain/uncharacterized damage-inducible protein DinB
MSANRTSVKVVRTIQTSSEMVFEALAYECRLREWMCDGARTVPRKGGLFYVWWNSGYEARGVFTSYSPPRGLKTAGALAFTWGSPYEPGETSVKITLKPVEGGTKVTLTHTGFGTGKKWAGRAEESEREWNGGLDNLKSTLETGVDLRQARLPRFGLRWEPAPDEAGALVTIVMEGGPADLAGLRRGDVIIRMAGCKVRNEQDLLAVFHTCRAGQRVPIIFLREGKRHATTVELGASPVLGIPDDPAVLVEQVRKSHEEAVAVLRATVLMIPDEQAEQSPAEGEWSVKQTLAHLSASERGFQSWTMDVLLGNATHWIEARLPEQFSAVFASAPTVGALLNRFERDMAESRALVAAITSERRANKWRYRQIAQMLSSFGFHTQDHIQQIQAIVQAVQGK